ncbi:hypothetical protein JQ617_08040 [Bradyrhizobium sp. KB893862 SZCCT0404]|uniref:phage adaptor protein n=1 Tax=Bradyrhizobium sp. KB893862 SZCCT0404 TaxID=2807672 RepID=UPI001BAE4219|nr:hypothetical protein [Bradyrhizobium sp. KB893862 SZCCT0404]MBR1173900.1 hypothetical protein [Bradyrhizobium sp. KB893862 SZCCT0404]
MNYGELKADFLGLLKRRDITDTQADSFIQKAVNRVQRVLRIPPMEKAVAITYDGVQFTDGQIPIPSDYLRLISMTATDPSGREQEVVPVALNEVLQERFRTACPTKFVRRGGYWQFAPSPAVGTVFRIDYYDEFPTLSAAGDTSYLTTGAADLVTYGALKYAADYFMDKRKEDFENTFQTIRLEIEEQAANDALINARASAAYQWPED